MTTKSPSIILLVLLLLTGIRLSPCQASGNTVGGANTAIRSIHDQLDRMEEANAEDEDVHLYGGNTNDIGNLYSAGDNARIIGGTEVRH